MIECHMNVTLLDLLYVAALLPPDEIEQMEQLTGATFSPDECAARAWLAQGPKWVIKKDGYPLSVFGAVPDRPGVWTDFMVNTPGAFAPANFASVTRHCRRAMDYMFNAGHAHRIQCITPVSRGHVFRWYKTLGYHQEAVLSSYLANGTDAVIFCRTKDSHGLGRQQFSDGSSDSGG